MPYFSIIIPIYNTSMFIDQTIKSILNQTYQDYGIILIDDGSTDGSIEKCFNFEQDEPRVQLIRHDTRRGVSIARNICSC